jgi:hypothetical protein
MRDRLGGLAVWLAIATLAGAIANYGFGASFWPVAVLTVVSLAVNGWIIEWEERQPGRWSE